MSKTPRERITDFLDASKTQTVNISRTRRGGLVRTPDIPAIRPGQGLSRTPQSTRQSQNAPDSLQGRQKLLTPDVFLSSGLKSHPQHDRVSILKGKRRSLSSVDSIETPRQLIEGFLEANDTTAPLVRYSSRISDGRKSTSQSAISAARFSTDNRGEFDMDTPRTLIQNYMMNTADAAETPAPPSGVSQSSSMSPKIHGIANTAYHTPSPFKDSSPGPDMLSAVRSPLGKTPRSVRSKRGKFSSIVGEFINQTADVSVIPATNPDDYQVPSPFKDSPPGSDMLSAVRSPHGKTPRSVQSKRGKFSSIVGEFIHQTGDVSVIPASNPDNYQVPSPFQSSSDEESFVPVSQPSGRFYKPRIRQGKFDITVSSPLREAISRYRHSQRENSENIALSQNQEHYYSDHRSSDEENDANSRASQRSNRYVDAENRKDDQGEEIDGDYNYADSRASQRSNRYVDAENREGDDGVEIDADYKYADSRASQMSNRYVDAENQEGDEGEEIDGDNNYADSRANQRSNRYTDAENREGDDYNMALSRHDGRSDRPGVLLLPSGKEYEYTLPLKGNTGDFNNSDNAGDRMSRLSSSSMEISPIISDKGNQLKLLELQDRHSRDSVKAGRWSAGHVSRFGSLGEIRKSSRHNEGHRSFEGQMDIEKFVLPRRPRSVQSHSYQSMEQVGVSRKSAEHKERDESGRLSYSTHEQTDNLSRRSNRTPVVTEQDEEIYFAEKLQKSRGDSIFNLPNLSSNFSPRVTSTQREKMIVVNPMREKMVVVNQMREDPMNVGQVDQVSPGQYVSPTLSAMSRSTGSESGNRSRSRILTPSQRENQSRLSLLETRNQTNDLVPSVRQLTPRGLSERSSTVTSERSSRGHHVSRSMSPFQTVTPSPVVSSGSNSMGVTPNSFDLKPSKRRSHTPQQSTSNEQLTPRSNSKRSRSNIFISESPKKSSPLQTVTPSPVVSSGPNSTENSLTASPVVASRRMSKGKVNPVPNSTINFSPIAASTQNIASISKPPAEQDNVAEDIDRDNNQMDVDEDESAAAQASSSKQKAPAADKPKRAPRKPREKDKYSIPTRIVKKQFTHYAGVRVDKDAIVEVMEISEKYWDQLAKDLEAYALHAGRKRINMEDFDILFRRQGLVNDKVSLKSLIEKYLPMEEREKLIHVARAGKNTLDPKI